jgi:hypothetical protein
MRENRTYGLMRGLGRAKALPALLYCKIFVPFVFKIQHQITDNIITNKQL